MILPRGYGSQQLVGSLEDGSTFYRRGKNRRLSCILPNGRMVPQHPRNVLSRQESLGHVVYGVYGGYAYELPDAWVQRDGRQGCVVYRLPSGDLLYRLRNGNLSNTEPDDIYPHRIPQFEVYLRRDVLPGPTSKLSTALVTAQHVGKCFPELVHL